MVQGDGESKISRMYIYRQIRICAYNDNKHINLNDKEEQQLWITKNW